jgi:hypothetical protein
MAPGRLAKNVVFGGARSTRWASRKAAGGRAAEEERDADGQGNATFGVAKLNDPGTGGAEAEHYRDFSDHVGWGPHRRAQERL